MRKLFGVNGFKISDGGGTERLMSWEERADKQRLGHSEDAAFNESRSKTAKLSELLLPSASLCSAALWHCLAPQAPHCVLSWWFHLSQSEPGDSWSEMHNKLPSLSYTAVQGACAYGLCGLNVQCKWHLSVSASISAPLIWMQGHVYITRLPSELEVSCKLASLCIMSCIHDVLMRIPSLKDVWSTLASVTSFAKKYRLDYDQTPHSGHSISRRSRLEVGWDECMPCLVPPLLCREELWGGGHGTAAAC